MCSCGQKWIQICNKADADRKNSKQVTMYLTRLVDLRKEKGKGHSQLQK